MDYRHTGLPILAYHRLICVESKKLYNGEKDASGNLEL